MRASGTFEVAITPEGQTAAPEGGVPVARMALAKTFAGDLQGTAVGTMISGGVPKAGSAAAYVAIDQFAGRLGDREGGFMLVHRGLMTKSGEMTLDIVIAPDTGYGAMDGIRGALTIRVEDGQHFYDLDYDFG